MRQDILSHVFTMLIFPFPFRFAFVCTLIFEVFKLFYEPFDILSFMYWTHMSHLETTHTFLDYSLSNFSILFQFHVNRIINSLFYWAVFLSRPHPLTSDSIVLIHILYNIDFFGPMHFMLHHLFLVFPFPSLP